MKRFSTPAGVCGLTRHEQKFHQELLTFAREVIGPRAAQIDAAQEIPAAVLADLAQRGYFGANVAAEYGGTPLSSIKLGLLHHAIGTVSSSVRSVLTAHGMVCEVLQRWGSVAQKDVWLRRLATGQTTAAFALSEPQAGSDWHATECAAVSNGELYALSGAKRWITAGQFAGLFLVIAKNDGLPAPFLVSRDSDGLSLSPLRGQLGLRGAMLASLDLHHCLVAKAHRVGGSGFGGEAVVACALDFGRYTVAWGCAGIGQACLDASLQHASTRRQGGVLIGEHQLVRAMITDMLAKVRAAGTLCVHAGRLRGRQDPASVMEVCVAKYAAAKMCAAVSQDAVQIHGASGCSEGSLTERHYRDAKIMEIIEGSNQVQQDLIARLAFGYCQHEQ